MRPFQALDLTLVLSTTTSLTAERPPALILVVDGVLADASVEGMAFPPERCGTLTVVAPEQPLTQHVLDTSRMREFVSALEPLLVERDIELDGIPDTSDTIHYAKLQGAFDGTPFRFDFSFMSSGYEGVDAAAFANLVRTLVEPTGAAWRRAAGPLVEGVSG